MIDLDTIPSGLIGSNDIYVQTVNVNSYRETVKQTSSDIINNIVSYRDTNIKNEVESLIVEINKLKTMIEDFIVPVSDKAAFIAGTVTLLDYIDIESVSFYSQLDEMIVYIGGIKLAIREYENTAKQTIGAIDVNNEFLEILSSEDFGSDTGNIFVDQEVPFITYDMKAGETLQDVAEKFLGDANKFTDIATLNGLTDSNFVDGGAGTQIRIPYIGALTNNNPNNLVYEVYRSAKPEDIANYLYGSDLYLAKGKLQTTGNGDLRVIKGVNNVVGAITRRSLTIRGTYHPGSNYGLADPGSVSESLPFEIQIQKFITDAEMEIAKDPRIQSAIADVSKLDVEADKIVYPISIKLIGGLQESPTFSTKVF